MLADAARVPHSGGDAVRKAVHDELTLQLPSAGGGPLASPELVRPGGAGSSGVPALRRAGQARPGVAGELAGAVLALGPAAALAVLGFGLGGPPDESAIAGGSLTYLAAVAAFRGRPGRARPGAARARGRGRGLRGPVAPGARRRRRAARP